MKRPAVFFLSSLRRSGISGLLMGTLVIAVSLCTSPLGQGQEQTANREQNAKYVHPPQGTPAPALHKDALHPPPAPNAGPKVQPGIASNGGALPKRGRRAEKEQEDTENLVRNWKARRPISEVRKAVHESMAMPSEPHAAGVTAPTTTTPRDPNEAPPPLSTTGWEQIGYGNFSTDDVHHHAGRIRQASYAYDNSQGFTTLWLGATGGGLWRGINLLFAVVFVPVSDNLPGSPSVGAFLVQPGNSNNILIASGDSYRYGGTGMYKTTDGGATWSEVNPSDGTGWPSAFQKVLIDVGDTTNQTVLAQGDTGIWRSTDFGSTWYQVYSGSASDLVQDPVYPYIWYAGAPGTGVLRSTSSGTSFGAIGCCIAGPIGRVSVAVSAAATWHVYAISAITDGGGVSRSLGGIWRSDDYGDGTWNKIESTDNISGAGQAFHTTAINVDPNNADIVFAGMAGSQVTYNGTAGTPTWTYSSSFDEGHSDHTGYVFEPGTTNVISTTDGGVYVLDEFALTVSGSLNYATNLNVQQVFGAVGDLACSLNAPDECISGLQDNGTITINRNNSPPLVTVGGGDGNSASIAPDNPNELFQMGNGGRWYSTDGAGSWTGDYGSCLANNYYTTTMIDQTPPNGFTPYIYTFSVPTSGSTNSYVYYKTVNPNCDWSAANPNAPFVTTSFSPRLMDASNDPTGYVFYVEGWGSSTLYVLDSYSTGSLGSMSYVDRTPPLPWWSSFNDSQVAADRSSLRPYTVTYTTGGSRPSRAFLSNDRGQSWSDVTGDLVSKLPSAGYYKLIANPADQSQLFLGTDQGIYRSDNFGVNWYRYMDGLPAVMSIDGLELNYDYSNPPLLHVGSYGRGFWDRQVASDAVLSSVSDDGPTIIGGKLMDFVVWLDRQAPKDVTVTLTSSNQSLVPLPANVTVGQGYFNAGIVVTTGKVSQNTTVTLTATYNQVQKSISVTVTPVPATATVVTSSKNPSTFGGSVTFTASVTSGTPGTITGTVTFKDGAAVLGAAGLSGGKAVLATSALGAGSHSITAIYSGDTNFSASTSVALSQVVNKAASTTSLASSVNPSKYGAAVTFTATVSSTGGTPTGSVTFKDGSATLGLGTLSGGHATFATSSLAVGGHSITAVYAGSTNFGGSASAAVAQTVTKAGSLTSVASSVNPSSFHQTVKFTATVKSSTSGTPTGSVTFKDGASTLGSGTLNASGVATLSTANLSVASHTITAVYGGSGNFLTSTSAKLAQAVKKASTHTTLVSSLNPSKKGQAVTFRATITPAFGGTPGGTVTFKDGSVTLGTGSVSATTHQASFTTSTMAVGTHHLTAAYGGNVDFNTSSSAVLNQVVNP